MTLLLGMTSNVILSGMTSPVYYPISIEDKNILLLFLMYSKLYVYIGFLSNKKSFCSCLGLGVKPVSLCALIRRVLLNRCELRSNSRKDKGPFRHLRALLAEMLITWQHTDRVLDSWPCQLPCAASAVWGGRFENALIWPWSLDLSAALQNPSNCSIDADAWN